MLLKMILWPFSLLYGTLMLVRRQIYACTLVNFRKSAPIKSIVIGNLRVGGTGKSMVVGYLAEVLRNQNIPMAILSRGYGRQTRGFLEVTPTMISKDCGDEPLMLKKQNPQICVAVCENRFYGLQQLLNIAKPLSGVLLDDAFQHLNLKAHHYILLTEWERPFFNDYVLPLGRLREFRKEAKNADQILVTKVPAWVGPKQKEAFLKQIRPYSNAPVFWGSLIYGNMVHVQSMKPTEIPASTPITLVTGIDNPAPLLDYLREQGRKITHIPFADHKELKLKTLVEIAQKAAETKSVLLTTEKDAVRYFMGKNIPAHILKAWHFIEVRMVVENEQEFLNPLFTLVS